MPRLENWSVQFGDADPYKAPEQRKAVLVGTVTGHPVDRFNGTKIHTSSLVNIDIKNNQAQTKNTLYELGEPDADWLKWMKENGYSLEQYQTKKG